MENKIKKGFKVSIHKLNDFILDNKLYLQTDEFEPFNLTICRKSKERSQEDYERLLTYIALYKDNKPVALAYICQYSEGMWREKKINENVNLNSDSIFSVYVLPEYRGKGLAKKAIKLLEQNYSKQLLKDKNHNYFICSDGLGYDLASNNMSLAFVKSMPPKHAIKEAEKLFLANDQDFLKSLDKQKKFIENNIDISSFLKNKQEKLTNNKKVSNKYK